MKSKKTIIVELGDQVIKTCETPSKKGAIQLLQVQDLPQGISPEKIEEVFLKLSKLNCDNITISLPRSLFLIRFLTLPSIDAQEIRKMLPFQLAKVIPYPLSEIVYDFSIAQTQGGGSKVIVFIIQKKKLDNLLKPLQKYKNILPKITITTCGLINWLIFQARFLKKKVSYPNVVVDIDKYNAELLVIADRGIGFSRSFDYASDEQLLSGIKQSMIIFEKEFGKKDFDKIIFTGIRKNKIIEAVRYGEGIFIESWQNFSLKRGLEKQIESNVSFSSLLGLGEKTKSLELDFSPQYLTKRKATTKKKRQYVEFGFIGLEIIFILAVLLSLYSFDRYFYRDFLDSRLKGMKVEVKEIDKVMRRLKVIDKEFFKGQTFSENLSTVISSLGPNTQLVFLEFQENGEFSLKGYAKDIANVFSIVKNINDSGLFSDTKIKYASQLKRKDRTVVEFYIEGKERGNK